MLDRFSKRHIHFFFKRYKTSILFISLLVISIFSIIPSKTDRQNKKKIKSKKEFHVHECNRSMYASAPIEPQRQLNDLNEIHNLHAEINGIPPYETNQEFLADVNTLVEENILVEIKNNEFYKIKDLTHSYPFVTPEMNDLLDIIGIRFKEKLAERNLGDYQFYITSVLRTVEFQRKLSRVNRNATVNSAHYYGTTADILYREYFNVKTKEKEANARVADALKDVMSDLREECRLLVIRERRQPVYHFTVVNCDPSKSLNANN